MPRANGPTLISLVVPLRNEERSVGALVDSILRQTRPPDEVVLVDGGSTDETTAALRSLTAGDARFRVVEAGDATPGQGRNVGASLARHAWLAFTDAGIKLEPAWLERLAAAAEEDPRAEVVYGNYEPVTESFFERCAALAYVAPKELKGGGMMRGPFIASALMLKEVWEKAGGFPDLRAAEDLIFFERVERGGFVTKWSPGATVWWQIQPGFAGTFRRFALYSKHNVWAGRQRFWHYGVARQYAFVLPFVVLAAAHSAWWMAAPLAWILLRALRSVWRRREGRGPLWALNPARLFGVAAVLLTVDAATFAGWAQALGKPAPARAGRARRGGQTSEHEGSVRER